MTGGAWSPGPAQPWWSDGANDPWRNPESETVIVSRAPAASPPPERPPEPSAGPGQLRLILTVALAAGLLAGGLGGAIGYVAAANRQAPTVVVGGGSSPPPQRPTRSLAGIVSQVMPSVVTVQGQSGLGESIGSGFVISSEGYILTNEHVVADVPDGSVKITFNDSITTAARVVGRDAESDLAVIKVTRPNLRPVQFANSDQVAVGDNVIAVGSPLALAGTVTAGIVSALDRTIETRDVGGAQRYYAAIQTDAAVNRGNSGGPLFNMEGRVIGINSVIKSLVESGEEGGNIGIAFAIPSNQAARIANEIIDTGRAKRTVIGAQLGEFSGGGVRLTRVDAGGPAAEAGLRTGDVVVRLGTHVILGPPDLIALVRRYDPGTVVTLTYRRGSLTQTASVTLVAASN